MDDELKKLTDEVFETDSTDTWEWREAARKLARAVLEQDAELARLREANRLMREAIIKIYHLCENIDNPSDAANEAMNIAMIVLERLRQRALASVQGGDEQEGE